MAPPTSRRGPGQRWTLRALVLLAALAAPTAASADRFVDPGGPTFLSVGSEMVAFGGHVYFAANDGVVGNELWRTDGTAAGTTLVKDFVPGAASDSGNPRDFTISGNRLFFHVTLPAQGSNTVHFVEAGGAPQQAQLGGGAPANASFIGVVGDKIAIAQLENDNSNYGLYVLGQAGTTFTKISSGFDNVSQTEPGATVGNKLIFSAAFGATSRAEPWVTDGTPGGTGQIKEIRPGDASSGPVDFVATSTRVYFVADDGTRGRELWASDGTSAGTSLVYEHHPLSTGTGFKDIAVANGETLYYVPNDPVTGSEVWRTEGTAASTRVVRDLVPGANDGGANELFTFRNGYGLLRNGDVHFSDGTAAGTVLVATPGGDGFGPRFALAVGDRAYFSAGFSPFGGVVWRTDGTAAGSLALTAGPFDAVGTGVPLAGRFAKLGTKVVFTARYPHPAGDGIPADARRVYVIDTQQADQTRQATAAPSIGGTPAVGQRLTGDKGTWTLEPNTYSFAWLRNGTPIPNATAAQYTPGAADAGAQLVFRVTARGLGGPNVVSADSAPRTVGGAPPGGGGGGTPPGGGPGPGTSTKAALTLRRKARMTGQARVGKRLKLVLPAFGQKGVKRTIRWFIGSKRIAGQTRSTLKVPRSARGKRITARVTASKPGYATRTFKIGPTKRVKPRR